MALKVYYGSINRKSKRRAGRWATQSNETVVLGPSRCKFVCRRIVYQNRRRNNQSRITKSFIASLEGALDIIVFQKWEAFPIGVTALASISKTLLKNIVECKWGSICHVVFKVRVAYNI